MRVLLVNPPWVLDGRTGVRAGSRWPHLKTEDEANYLPFPFFMAYAGALLKQNGFEVLLVDAIAEELTDKEFFKKSEGFRPDVVLQEVSTPSLDIDLVYAKRIKELTNAKIALSGLDVNITDLKFLKGYAFIDFVLLGEYEYTLLDLVRHLEEGTNVNDVLGLIHQSNGKFSANARRPLIENLDDLPWPLREQLPMQKYEDRPGGIPWPSVQMWASRGCPHRCIFCAWPQIMYGGNSYRTRDPKRVVDEMEYLVNNMGFKSVYFDDDTFNIGKKRMLKFCDEVKKRKLNVPWAAMARADNMDKETLAAMKAVGLEAVKYGVESGTQKLVNSSNKSLDLGRVRENIKLTKELGIHTHLTFMFGLPGETKETIQRTLDFALAMDPESVQFSIATPFPGTDYFRELDNAGRIITKNWSDYDGNFGCVIKSDNLSAQELIAARKRAYAVWREHPEHRVGHSTGPYALFKKCLRENGIAHTIRKTISYIGAGKYRHYEKAKNGE